MRTPPRRGPRAGPLLAPSIARGLLTLLLTTAPSAHAAPDAPAPPTEPDLLVPVEAMDGRCAGPHDPDCQRSPLTPQVTTARLRTDLLASVVPGRNLLVRLNLGSGVAPRAWIEAPQGEAVDGEAFVRWRAGLVDEPDALLVLVGSPEVGIAGPQGPVVRRLVALLLRSRRWGSFEVRPIAGPEELALVSRIDPRGGRPCGVGREVAPDPLGGPGGCGHRPGPRAPPEPAPPTALGRARSLTRPARLGTPGFMAPTRVDLLLLYTPAAIEWVSGSKLALKTTLRSYVDLAHDVLLRSGTNVDLQLVGLWIVFPGSIWIPGGPAEDRDVRQIWERLVDPAGELPDAHRLRDIYRADLVALVVDTRNSAWAGYGSVYHDEAASVDEQARDAFCVVRASSLGEDTLTHEFGHGLGACHFDGAPEPPCGAPAYRRPHTWRDGATRHVTLMAPDSRGREPWFSNPDLRLDGYALGVAGQADNARMMREAAPQVAQYR